ncbi:MAG: 30S ribosomal protein S6 [Clostridia bacterium]|nr:30S ribosomal protein S6 [Clostridia bacterium]
MNKYEVLYILDAKLDDGAKDALIERFKGVVESANGSVEGVDKWGVRKLAYDINFKSEGYYVLMNFTADADTPDELERQMRITDGVMRFIVIKK